MELNTIGDLSSHKQNTTKREYCGMDLNYSAMYKLMVCPIQHSIRVQAIELEGVPQIEREKPLQTRNEDATPHDLIIIHRFLECVLPIQGKFCQRFTPSYKSIKLTSDTEGFHKDKGIPKTDRTSRSKSRFNNPATVGVHPSSLPGRL